MTTTGRDRVLRALAAVLLSAYLQQPCGAQDGASKPDAPLAAQAAAPAPAPSPPSAPGQSMAQAADPGGPVTQEAKIACTSKIETECRAALACTWLPGFGTHDGKTIPGFCRGAPNSVADRHRLR